MGATVPRVNMAAYFADLEPNPLRVDPIGC